MPKPSEILFDIKVSARKPEKETIIATNHYKSM